MRRAWSLSPPDLIAFEHALAKAGLPLVKVNPRQARRFAEATGKLAKTDRLDAALLARMGALLAIEPRPCAQQGSRRTQGAPYRPRGAGQGSHRRQEPRQNPDARAVETAECATPRPDRTPDRRHRRSHSRLHRSQCGTRQTLRHPDEHSWRLADHRLRFAD